MSFARILFLVREDWNGKILRDKLTLTCTLLAILNSFDSQTFAIRCAQDPLVLPKTLCLLPIGCGCSWYRYGVPVAVTVDWILVVPVAPTNWILTLIPPYMSFFFLKTCKSLIHSACLHKSFKMADDRKKKRCGRQGDLQTARRVNKIPWWILPYGLYWRFDLRSG